MKNPTVGALLSLVVPGVGQVYSGHWFWAIFWLIVTPGFWIGTGGMLGWVCHFLSAYQAYRQVKHQRLIA